MTYTMTARYSAAAARLEFVLQALRYSTSTADRQAAAKAVAYCRARAAGGRENHKVEREIDAFAEAHGLALDWLFTP